MRSEKKKKNNAARRLLTLTALAAASTAPASAAEQQTLTREHPTATFQGEIGAGVPRWPTDNPMFACRTEYPHCETTLVRIGERGRFVATATPDLEVPYLDEYQLRLYRSDAAGARGPQVSGSSWDAWGHNDLPAGFYLLLVQWDEGAYSYTGRLELTPRPDDE